MAQILIASDGAGNSGDASWAGGVSGFTHGVARAGTVTIGAGSATGTVAFASLLGLLNQPAVVTLNTVDQTLTTVLSAVWSTNLGNSVLTITGDANATADVTVSYAIFKAL
jgi:hypothetical protein